MNRTIKAVTVKRFYCEGYDRLLKKFTQSETEKWVPIIKAANISF